jgi:hypothetical protein
MRVERNPRWLKNAFAMPLPYQAMMLFHCGTCQMSTLPVLFTSITRGLSQWYGKKLERKNEAYEIGRLQDQRNV